VVLTALEIEGRGRGEVYGAGSGIVRLRGWGNGHTTQGLAQSYIDLVVI
jgi:hypothetical protein